MDGILYKGRMKSQEGARPLTSVEKDLAGEGRQAFWAPSPSVLALLASMSGCRQGPELAPFLTGGSSHSHLQKCHLPGITPGARETQGSKKGGCALEYPRE